MASKESGVAALRSVTQLVIALSIAQRSHLMYGRENAQAQRTAAKATSALARALELQGPVALRFTPEAVFCGVHSLERNNPIHRSFAERMWRLGVCGLTFHESAGEDDLRSLIEDLSQVVREHANHERGEEILRGNGKRPITVQFLHKALRYSTREKLDPVDAAHREQAWEALVTRLGEAAGLTGEEFGGDGGEATPTSELTGDYASAVVDYLKQMQRAQQKDALLRETETGRKLADLLEKLNPELQRQIVESAVEAEEVDADTLHALSGLVGEEQFVESLSQLNSGGGKLSEGALGAVLMLVSAHGGKLAELAHEQGMEDLHDKEKVGKLLAGLLAGEDKNVYSGPAYAKTLERISRLVQRPTADTRIDSNWRIPPGEHERHFIQVAEELLRASAQDRGLAAAVTREAEISFARFAEAADVEPALITMGLANRARVAAGGAVAAEPPGWESDGALDPLIGLLMRGDRWQAEGSGQILAAIGPAAVPKLLGVLAKSDDRAVRRRAVGILETLPGSLVPQVLPLLVPGVPWYLQRNALVVLRRRREADAAEAAKALWPVADPRVKHQIAGYLFDIGDPGAEALLQRGLTDADHAVVLDAARQAIATGYGPLLDAVIARCEIVPAHHVGGAFHLSLLEIIAGATDPRGAAYVAALPGRRRPLLPWNRERFRREVAGLVGRH